MFYSPKGKLVKHVKHPYRLHMIQNELCHSYIPFFVKSCWAWAFTSQVIERSPVGPQVGSLLSSLECFCTASWTFGNQQIVGCFHPSKDVKPREHQRFHDRLSMRFMTYTAYTYTYTWMVDVWWIVIISLGVTPPPSNSHHQNYHIFNGGYLWAFICHWKTWLGLDPKDISRCRWVK